MDRPADRGGAEFFSELVDGVSQALTFGPRRLVEAELTRGIAGLEPGRRDSAQPDPTTLSRLDRNLAEKIDRGACEDAAIRGRHVERGSPRDLPEVVVLDDQHDH